MNDQNQVFSTESSLPSFSTFLQARNSLSNSFSYTDLCIPFILPSSIKLQYQENFGDEIIQSWAYLSDNREYEDAYAPLIEAISKSSINSRGIPQFNDCCSYSINETKGNSCIQINQKLAVSFQVQNPLNEELSILEMKLLSSMNEEMMEDIANKFDELVSPILLQIQRLRDMMNKSAQARDRLLPKLMSGEIDISEVNYE